MTLSLKKSALIFTLLLLGGKVSAQVTIGDITPPVAGALLQLKDGTTSASDTLVNASKGLGLPRVKLRRIKNPASIDPKDIGMTIFGVNKRNAYAGDHTGMVIYNISEDMCATDPLVKGMYVWDGSKWNGIGTKEKQLTDVYTITDSRDGKTYLARSFGEDAGDWMLENMRYIDPSMTIITDEPAISKTARVYGYPQVDEINYASTPPTTWLPAYGLLYTYAATLGAQDGIMIDQGQVAGSTPGPNEVESTASNGRIQGICPVGWHIPSDREWNKLEQEIYNNADKYSNYTADRTGWSYASWDPDWNTTYGMRGSTGAAGHASAMLYPCMPLGITNGSSFDAANTGIGGKSPSAKRGGFCVMLTGYIINGDTGAYYGVTSEFLTVSVDGQNGYYKREIFQKFNVLAENENSGVFRGIGDIENELNSVRCKKD